MVLTHLLLVLTVATVAIGQERECTYTDQEDARSYVYRDTEVTANTLEDCKGACDGETQCVAVYYQAKGGTAGRCGLYYSVPSTVPATVSTFSTNTCSDNGQGRVCTYTDQEYTDSNGYRDTEVTANTLADCKNACDGDTQCVALYYTEQGGTGVSCGLYYSVPGTRPATVSTFSFQNTCSVKDACSESPCQNGATCIVDAENDAFTCLCPFGFAGDTCQEECDFTCPPIKSCRHGNFQLEITGNGTCPSFTCVEKDKPGNGFGRFKGLRRFIRQRWLHG